MSTIMRVAIPAALISVPIVALLIMPTLIILALAKNEDDLKKLIQGWKDLRSKWKSLTPGRASKFARLKIVVKIVFAILAAVYVLGAFAFSAYGILLMFNINISSISSWVKLVFLTLALLCVYFLAILSVSKKASLVFSVGSVLFFLLAGCVEYHWMPAFLASDGLATNGFGKVYLSTEKSYPLLNKHISCKPYYMRTGAGNYMLAYAKLRYTGNFKDIIEYVGYSSESITKSLEELSDIVDGNGTPSYPKSALCLASIPIKSSMLIFHGADNLANIERIYSKKDFSGYKADLKYIVKNISRG
ncbi:MAG: hypothetical protein ACYCY0_09275 [Acidithiobacillus ferrivorans]